ncbi:hypothetical protein AB0J63_01375 [Streptosporangium canum]|uniref:helix-turn-helix domain-containing protein n=1 Tax=Streptosporangium canum TaxID=324952 RepID=UPI003435F439
MEAAGLFAGGEKNAAIARTLRVSERSVERWRRSCARAAPRRCASRARRRCRG